MEADHAPSPHAEPLAVLFADVSGSTQLYETLGDVRARGIIAHSIALMTDATHRHGGTLVKIIGDEVMTTFPDANAATQAACEMQETITGQMMVEGRRLAIRVGFHFGPTLREETDVFGDTVNLAARLANQAKSGQILTSGSTVARLTGPQRTACRLIDLTEVRGKRERVEIHEIVWRASDATVNRAPWATEHRPSGRLLFIAGGTRVELGEGHPSLTIGRADQNDLVVRDPLVSRLHSRIEYRNGRFVLTDLSANGTYVVPDEGSESYVHRDNKELAGSGTLGLGQPVSPGSPTAVRFEPG